MTEKKTSEGAYLLKKIKDRCRIDGDCWIWSQSINNKGQPQMSHNGMGGQMVRRLAMTSAGRAIKDGHVVTAIDECENALCCNPDHIRSVSRSVLLAKQYKTGARNPSLEVEARRRKAVEQGWSKLNEVLVGQIREMLAQGIPKTHIAKEFGVHEKTIYCIDRGIHWHKTMAASVFDWRPAQADPARRQVGRPSKNAANQKEGAAA